ncbi:MAG: HU family DNA-binding protein [Muribaculaceae bacterium]|nr:HU family DNA-binding protein [Muribaculaceae bacterium]
MDNKTFIEELSRRLDLSRETVGTLIENFSETLGKRASEMEGLAVPNFGVFEPRMRQERIALHPASGKRLLVPPRISLSFKCSPALKLKINNGK